MSYTTPPQLRLLDVLPRLESDCGESIGGQTTRLSTKPTVSRASFLTRFFEDVASMDDLMMAVEEVEADTVVERAPETSWQQCIDELKLEPGCDRKSCNVVRSGIAQVSSTRFFEHAILDELELADKADGKRPGICRSIRDVVRFGPDPRPERDHAALRQQALGLESGAFHVGFGK
eukprot:TRINITY_DN21640_c0_g1_i3.p1 TRINITY_DN21640_c0_g1~~TRINITY_DN21640_c0_g1_i3.p1  ORF type:complete len:192 (-),score=18.11 TRINITY_DN21640_c0_g1_i3:819-1346(-)